MKLLLRVVLSDLTGLHSVSSMGELPTKRLRETFVNNWKHNLERRDFSIAKGQHKLKLFIQELRRFSVKRSM